MPPLSPEMQALVEAAAKAAGLAFFVRGLIDAFKAVYDPPRWVAPTAALVLGPLLLLILSLAAKQPLTVELVAGDVVAGLLAGGVAIGSVKLSEREKVEAPAEPTVQAIGLSLYDE